MTPNEIDAFLMQEAVKQKITYSNVKAKYAKEFGESEFYASDIMSIPVSDSMPLDMKLRNVLALANNNMVAGLYCEYKSRGLEKKLNEEKKLKQAAFLFILRYGMIKEFQSFVNNYHGDTKEDICCERMKHA